MIHHSWDHLLPLTYFYIARLAALLNLSCVFGARNAHTHGPIHCVISGRCNRNFRCHPEIKDTGRSRTRQPTARIDHLRKEIQKNRIISWPLGQDLITLDGLLGARCKFWGFNWSVWSGFNWWSNSKHACLLQVNPKMTLTSYCSEYKLKYFFHFPYDWTCMEICFGLTSISSPDEAYLLARENVNHYAPIGTNCAYLENKQQQPCLPFPHSQSLVSFSQQ